VTTVAMSAPAWSAASERELVAEVVSWFGLGTVTGVRELPEGLMNRNWQVRTPAGVVAVKQVQDIGADAARRQHEATRALAGRGLPVLAPLAGPGGVTLLEHPAGVFAVLPWVAATHRGGLDLSYAECGMLGEVLGRLHAGLASVMPAVPGEMVVPVTEPAAARERIGRYLGFIEAKVSLDEFDRHARRELSQRRELLADWAHLRPADGMRVGPAGWTHGDFHDLNVLWDGGGVSAVLDWHRLGVRPVAAEVVRSGTLLFGYGDDRGLDLGRVAAFTQGYRAVVPLTDVQLADAVHRLWWERMCDFWQLKWHYERGDASCDHLFAPASALLAWWSGHRSEVSGAFTSS